MTDHKDIKILVVEDDAIIAEDLSSFLASEGFHIMGVAHDASRAKDILHSRQIDFAILDINLGTGETGIDVAEVIHEKYNIPYIFLTSFDDENTLNDAQQHAPYGYLVKPFQERSLLTTIKMANSNYSKIQDESGFDLEKLNKLGKGTFTNHEFKIINDLKKGLSYKQIASKNFISINTVKYHTKNIYAKFEIKGRSELVNIV